MTRSVPDRAEEFIVSYRGQPQKNGRSIVGAQIIAVLAVGVPAAFFVIQALATGEAGWWGLAAFSIALSLLFGPYATWLNGNYFLGLRRDGVLVMFSALDFLPRRHALRLEHIARIEQEEHQALRTLTFWNEEGRRIGAFNMVGVPRRKLDEILGAIEKVAPHIE